MTTEAKKKTQAHVRYKNQVGKIVPGVTTILGLLDKPAIHYWIANITKQGYDWTKYRDDKADIGSLAHALILADLKGETFDTSEYSKDQIDQAENSYLYYLDWQKGKEIIPIVIEFPLVSEQYQFGGTPDFHGTINGDPVLVDYKTGGIYKEAYIQTCAYRHLLIENGYQEPTKIIVLGIPRTTDEEFKEVTYTSFDTGWKIFEHLRAIYELQKDLR